ncbi:MAG: AbrB/MazE/SpoVT family DNA-binding domain-containing protein [Clostridiales Family XIII bacterium]|jgi:AbrB family looped-hinge helix DNA binding protein|nr:AbrB/MazE/SpoVT family DNA-binding domain-containing protein [Clostridiales Family XIII bacterium]
MDMARLSSKGQVTIPVDIRRKLGLREGDKVVFAEKSGNIVILNSNAMAWGELQAAFAGEAERVGWQSEEDAVAYCKEIRREMGAESDGHTD